MSAAARLDLCEDVALVTFAMMESLAERDEAMLPGRYRYHVFGGFPGFCDHAAVAGMALHTVFYHYDRDQWLDIASGYAEDFNQAKAIVAVEATGLLVGGN